MLKPFLFAKETDESPWGKKRNIRKKENSPFKALSEKNMETPEKKNMGNLKVLDLGCGKRKIAGAFGVDAMQLEGVDLVWDLNKKLPRKLHGKFDVVHHHCVLDHLGNPMLFLEECYKCLKRNGRLEFVIDNADYWRFHHELGNYHAQVWEKDAPHNPELHHKMMFQLKHLVKMLKVIGFEVVKTEYIRDYKSLRRGHLDYLMTRRRGCNLMRIEAVKTTFFLSKRKNLVS